MSEKNNLPKLTQDEANRLRGLYQGMHNLDFTIKIDSYKKLATQICVLRQQGRNVQEYEKHLTDYWNNWQDIVNNPIQPDF